MRAPVDFVDEEIARQFHLNSVDELDGLTGLTINLEEHIPRSEYVVEGSESLDDTIDRIIREDAGHGSLLDAGRPGAIADPLPPVGPAIQAGHQTPVSSSSLAMSSVLRLSMRLRSSAEQAARFRRPTLTPLAAHGMRMRPVEAPSPCPSAAASRLFYDSASSQPERAKDDLPPLALFDLSGSLPATAQLFPPSDSGTLADYSFKTAAGRTACSSRTSLLVAATQYEPGGDVVDMAKLLPTTPTLPGAATGSSVEIPPTQCPASRTGRGVDIPSTQFSSRASSQSQVLVANTQPAGAMSQVDLFAANFVNTQGSSDGSLPGTLSFTEPSLVSTFSPAIIMTPDQPIEVILEVPEEMQDDVEFPYSGHEMVVLPDSLGEDEDNPFTVKDGPPVFSDVRRISEPPVLPSQAPPTQDNSQADLPEDVLEVPRTAKKVKFAPTPVGSNQPPLPMTVSVYRTRTDTQEKEEACATSLTKFCQQAITGTSSKSPKSLADLLVPRCEAAPMTDVDERLMADGDIQISKPKTPLRIVSRGATPIKPFASASRTLTKIIEAMTPGKKTAASCAVSNVSSPCPLRVVKATPTAKRVQTSKSSQSAKKTKRPKPNPLIPAISSSTLLGEGLLVWAHWRPQYYTAGTVEKKKSIRREVWQVRPFHRTASTLDLSADHMLPLVLLEPGDTVLHITDRRKYKLQQRTFSHFVAGIEEASPLLVLDGGDQLELKDVVIGRALFTAKHKTWKASISNAPSSDTCDVVVDDNDDDAVDAENQDPNLQLEQSVAKEDEVRYSLTSVGLFSNLSFILTGTKDKSKLTAAIEEAGGTVIEELTSESLPDLENLFLISTDIQPCRTAKYYCAVLLGLERLKAGWIDASLGKGKLAPIASYRLHPRASRRPTAACRSPLFSDTHLAFVGSKSYKASCTQIASFTSASLVDPRGLASLKDRSVVVVLETSEALTPRLQATCLANGHLIAEKLWFTDSILQGRVLPLT